MDTLAQSFSLMAGFLTNPVFWAALVATVLLAGPFGLIPGVGSTTVIALALPFLVLGVDPAIGMVFVAGLIGLGNSMDSIPAVLLGYPSPGNAVTFLEGHQLAQRGLGARTLGALYAVSTIGGLVGAFALALVLPTIRPLIVNFSYPEIAAMAFLGILMVSVLSRGATVKGLAAATLGILLATIGPPPHAATSRFDMGFLYLVDGLPLVPVLLGFFALPEIIDLTMTGRPVASGGEVSTREVLRGVRIGLSKWRMAIRQSLFGVALGAMPGIGSAVVDWLTYAFGIALAKDKSEFGKGSLDGVLFAEAAQNSKEGGQAIPTLAFGIPGGAQWAMAIVALITFGAAPGIGMLTSNLDMTMGVILTIGLGNVLMAALAIGLTGQIAKVTLIPYAFVFSALLPLAVLSAFQATNNIGDIWALFAAGALGLAMKWYGWPRPPFILGFVLGPTIERNFWTALQFDGGPLVFILRPYAAGIVVLGVAAAVYLTWLMRKGSVGRSAATAVYDTQSLRIEGGSVDAPAQRRVRMRMPTLQWHWEYLFWTVLLAIVGGLFFRESMQYRESTQFVPLWGSVVFFVLIAVMLVQSAFSSGERRQIMDIGMRTGVDRAALLKLLQILAWIAGFVIAMGTVGLQLTALVFPVLFSLANTRLPGLKKLWALVPAALVAIVALGILDQALHVIWPEPFILGWFRG